MERGSAELRAYRDEAARLEAARRERAVHSQRMQRNAEPLTQNEVAGCWGTLGIWFIFPSFACYMLERRGNDRVGLCCGLWFLFCFCRALMTTVNGIWQQLMTSNTTGRVTMTRCSIAVVAT